MRYATINFTPLLDLLFILFYIVLSEKSAEMIKRIEIEKTIQKRLEKEKQSLSEEKENLEKLIEKLKQEAEKQTLVLLLLDQKEKELEKELNKLLQEKKLQEDKVKELLLQQDILSKAKVEAQKETAILAQAQKDLQKAFAMLQEKNKILQKEKEDLLKNQKQLEEKIQFLMAKIHALEKDKQVLTVEKNDQEKEALVLKEFVLKNKELTEQTQALEFKLTGLIEEKKKWVEEKSYWEQKNNEFQTLSDRWKEEKNALSQEILGYQNEIASVKEKNSTLLQHTKNLEEEIQKLKEILTDQKRRSEEELKKQISMNAALEQNTQSLQKQLGEIRDQQEKFQKSFHGQEIHKTFLKSEILTINFSVYEIVLDSSDQVLIRKSGDIADLRPYTIKKKNQFDEYFDKMVPKSVLYDSSKTIFMIIKKPKSSFWQEIYVKEKLQSIKALYGVYEYP